MIKIKDNVDLNIFTVTGYLYKDGRLLLCGMCEDLESFVEELKELNPKFVDRRNFKILTVDGYILKKWNRK